MNSSTIEWKNNACRLIDQTVLPEKFKVITCRDVKTLWHAIRTLQVRGAPAIGVAAAFGVLLGIQKFKGHDRGKFIIEFQKICDYLATARPTAVNLFNALADMKAVVDAHPESLPDHLKILLKKKAMEIFELDRRVCRQMGQHGARFIKNGGTYMTICNAGALATVDYGTALGVFYAAKEQGKNFKVFNLETRPLLQGSRLTSWELLRAGIDTTLIGDSMAATVMKNKKIDGVFVGADRIAKNGDTANKIGTYALAVLAKYHKIPFYVVAPLSTFDAKAKTGKDIPIEERGREEVIYFGGKLTAPKDIKVFNPAFDVTPRKLIAKMISEQGVY